jgi:hypothetical protein
MKYIRIFFALTALLLLAGSILAMSSTNYRLDWFIPLTGAGGGPVDSSHYAVNFTIGQSAIGACSSTNYGAGLGYWYGIGEYRVFLPLILRDAG